jgi:hypothetical protein
VVSAGSLLNTIEAVVYDQGGSAGSEGGGGAQWTCCSYLASCYI